VQKATVLSVASIALAGAVAGCGSSSPHATASGSGSAGSSGTSSQASSGGGYGYSSSSTAQPASSTKAALITTKHSKLGMILAVGGKELTVYMFEADKAGKSACNAGCASAWPPVTGTPKAAGQAVSADLGTIKRADGTTQVTYKGHPLYTYIQDGDSGDTYGEGIKSFGAAWYAVKPSGAAADES